MGTALGLVITCEVIQHVYYIYAHTHTHTHMDTKEQTSDCCLKLGAAMTDPKHQSTSMRVRLHIYIYVYNLDSKK